MTAQQLRCELTTVFTRECPPAASRVGWICFQIGLILLPSSALFATLLFILSLVQSSCYRGRQYWSDVWNVSLIVTGLLMLAGAIQAYSGALAWIGLTNWLPLFWGFWGFQAYLATPASRRQSGLHLVIGTVPVVLTGLGQIWWGWHGPWTLFGGLVVWFIAPGGEPPGRLSGLFDYANIAGAWLSLVWPFALAMLLQPSKCRVLSIAVLVLAGSLVTALVLTGSRNAWGALLLATPFVLGPMQWSWFLPLLLPLLLLLLLAVLPGVPDALRLQARRVVPAWYSANTVPLWELWTRIADLRYGESRGLQHTRLSQWNTVACLIAERPWLGWGAAAFTILYPMITSKVWHGHSHNLPFELAVSYGLPVALLVVGTVLALLILGLYCRVLELEIFDRAWWSAALVLVVLHSSDLPFFDSRLNVAGWILLAGLRCLIKSSLPTTAPMP